MSTLAGKTSTFRAIRRWIFAVEPMRHAWWETLFMRAIIAWASWIGLAIPSPFTSQPQPHGLAVWGVDFSWLGNAALATELHAMLIICLVLYVLRVLPIITLIPVIVCSVGHGVLGNSQGAIGHATQINTVVLLAQWLAYIWGAIQPRTSLSMPHGFTTDQLAIDWARQTVAATYVVSAISKLIESKGDWISDTPYFGLQIVKSNNMGFYDWLVPRTDGVGASLGQWFVDHPMASVVIFGAALPLELLVFLGLNNRRIALFFGLSLYVFHSTVTEMMQLGFLYHKMLLLALFINPPWWICQLIQKIRGPRAKDPEPAIS